MSLIEWVNGDPNKPDQSDVEIHMPYMKEAASKAGFVLELGAGHGNGSTRALSRGLNASSNPDKLMISIDQWDEKPEEKPPFPWWHELHGDTRSYLVLKHVQDLSGERKADVIYIDTDHTYVHLQRELEVWRNLAHPETIWIFHDTWMSGFYNPMTDAIKEFAAANPPLFYVELSRESHGLGGMRPFVGINAGSGQRPFPQKNGWINMDVQPLSYEDVVPDMVADMRNMPFPDEYADCVVSHHTLEHLGCGEADAFIMEAYRVLKPGGKLIIALPDIKALARRFLLGQISEYIFLVNMMGAYHGNEADRHKWHYTKDSLTELLNNNGHWRHTGMWDKESIADAPIAQDFWIMIMEARK